MRSFVLGALIALIGCSTAQAGEADVVGVEERKSGTGHRFDVTVRHADTGWDHYADKWEVLAPDGTALGTRVLAHPHVDEQPFTRSATVDIPDGIEHVIVRAHDKVDGYGGAEMTVAVPGQ